VKFNEGMYPPARLVVAVLALLCWSLAGCSAVELYRGNASATAKAEAGLAAATEDPTISALEGALAALRSSEQSMASGATQAAATIAAHEATPTTMAAAVAAPLPASAKSIVYGRVPIDSDRLNIIAALAFDRDGQLLAATRAGEIYALPDYDGDGAADETRLIFADAAQQLSRVAGLNAQGDTLILLHGGGLSLLSDANDDGEYETVSQLNEALPAAQSPLQASNGLVIAPDGRLFTVDVNSGEILLIVLGE